MQIKQYLQLARLPESLFLPLFSVSVSYLVMSHGDIHVNIIIPVLAAILGTGGMCALNDYYDIEVDKMGAKNRPLVTGKIKLQDGLAFAIILTIMGMFVAGISDKWQLPLIGGIAVFWGLLYNWKAKGKGLWGSITFGLIMVSLVLLGMVEVNTNILKVNVIIFLFFVFCTACANQMTANFYDYKTDKIGGYQTVPNMFGVKTGVKIVGLVRFIAIFLLFLFLLSSNVLNFYTILGLAVVVILILVSLRFLNMSHEIQNAKKAFKIAVLVTILTFLIIVIGIYSTPFVYTV